VLRHRETDLTATSKGPSGRYEDRVRVVWDRHSFPRYRLSLDDNSFGTPLQTRVFPRRIAGRSALNNS
jgi:hypothetical protein